MKFDKLAAILFVAILSGCATEQYHPRASAALYQKMLDTWTNKDINDLIYAWGPPSSTFAMPNTNKMFTWDNIKIGPTVTNTSGSSLYLGNGVTVGGGQSTTFTRTWDCYSTAITNSTGTILSWKLKGNNCMLEYSDEEVSANLAAVRALTSTLKKGTHIRLIIYGDTKDDFGRVMPGSFDGYFSGLNKDNYHDDTLIGITKGLEPTSNEPIQLYRKKWVQQLMILP